ncbi:peptidoglycan DD-metalloendopeptidase family protein [Ferrimonas sp. YFM]|uniref:peptidoglycan DD-metalloendopeptidase family protein n=1 Tax=Ferrimonas sp. YFM TaxID=3028878 RepID=UPI0025746DF5|nr:peptidoglycan DD-metalloendopeptidase family protein [Ferrimonas sp. YFM]BDY06396.1 family M23 zinc metallopeptidase with OapA domain protein [Ferrimonas sp. YFM]
MIRENKRRKSAPLTGLVGTFKVLPRPHRIGLTSILLLMLVSILLPSGNDLAAEFYTPLPLNQRVPLPLELQASEQPTTTEQALQWRSFTVQPGDSLARLFDRAGLSPQQLYRITQLPQAGKRLTKVMPGQEIQLGRDDQGELKRLSYAIDGRTTLVVTATQEGYQERLDHKEVEIRTGFASAEITSNFWNAAVNAGMTPNQIMSLAGIFGWDIDFALDIREGDRFSVLYEEEYIDGHYVADGKILAAEFTNQGDTFRAVRHSDGNYYSDKGKAMRKAFLRAPVQFNYVSSNFNPRRLHPVTKRVRPHNGTDYVAPVGTPIMAAGDGKVIKSAYNKLNGNYVFIQHGGKYVTKYLHLSKRKVKQGQRVRQGQTIGLLGATGRVTGAHLHYEFLVNGVHRNPRKVKLPEAADIAKKDRTAFLQYAEEQLAVLAHRQQIMVAMQ